MKKQLGVRRGTQVYPLINNTKSNLTSRKRAVLKGRIRTPGSKALRNNIFFRKKKADYACISQYKDRINIRIIEHAHVVLARTSVPALPRLEALLFHPALTWRSV